MLLPSSISQTVRILSSSLDSFVALWAKDQRKREDIATNPMYSEEYKNNQVANLPSVYAELRALADNIHASIDELKAAHVIWDDARAVLEIEAATVLQDGPRAHLVAAWLAESAVMDPATRQAAVEKAILTHGWARLYALTLGHIDQYGRSIDGEGPFRGFILDSLPISTRIQVMEILDSGEILRLQAEQAIHVWLHGGENYTLTHMLLKAQENLPKVRAARQAAFKLTPFEVLERNRAEMKLAGDESADLAVDIVRAARSGEESNIG